VGCLASGVPASAWPPLVFAPGLARVSAAGFLLVVVRLRRLCPEIFVEGAYIGHRWYRRGRSGDRMSVWRAREVKNSPPTAPRAGPRLATCARPVYLVTKALFWPLA